MIPDDDPGWPHGLSILAFLVPGVAQWQMRRVGAEDGLLLLRRVFTSFFVAIVTFGIVLAFLKVPRASILPWVPILVVLAIVSVVAGDAAERPLDCASDTALAGSYRTRFFLRIALAES